MFIVIRFKPISHVRVMDEVVGGARAAAPRQLSKASGHLLDDVDLLLSRTLDHEKEAVPCLLVPSCVPH